LCAILIYEQMAQFRFSALLFQPALPPRRFDRQPLPIAFRMSATVRACPSRMSASSASMIFWASRRRRTWRAGISGRIE
jgi:hypothetical protein